MADAFAELYEMADIVVVDVGRYGFVMLKYYMPPYGFGGDETYTDSRALFEALYQEWLNTKLCCIAKEMGMDDILYEKVFKSLPKEKQTEIIGRKTDFCKNGRGKYVNVIERVRIAVMNGHMPNGFYFVWK